ncbi:hypothetical protein K0B04_00965 [Patescibacteria group bacterium]|nr:hypothetical protein [Patescibacteria group bacterium]
MLITMDIEEVKKVLLKINPAPPPPPYYKVLIMMLPNLIILFAPITFLILYICYRIKKNPLFLKIMKYLFIVLLVLLSVTLYLSKSGIVSYR